MSRLDQVEVVERKGVGHPDTIADAVANEFSRRYSAYCLDVFDGVPRHSVDKLVLAGATSELTFGSGWALSPVRCLIVGKLTPHFAGQAIPTRRLAEEALQAVLQLALTDSDRLLTPEIHFETNAGVGAEHAPQYYSPLRIEHLDKPTDHYDANDTSLVFGHYRFSRLELLVLTLEAALSDAALQQAVGTGTDCKVLAVRSEDTTRLQLAVPFVADKVATERAYRDGLQVVEEVARAHCACFPELRVTQLLLNSKDRPGRGYLTLAGSSLDKGDQGAVGRGNG